MNRHLSLAVCLILSSLSPLFAADDAVLIEQGKAAYAFHCARCHGAEGKGDGVDAKRVPVVPRNLTEGIFKFQSTAQGTPPSDEDLLWILNHGMSGAGMPSFSNLSLDAKKSLIAFVKTLSPAFETAPEPLPAPNIKGKVDLKKGQELFTKLQCALCHGAGGRANGTSAFALKDKWERPIKVANLTEGWTFRAGDSATQIYYRLMAGINGAPMPSYAEAATPEEAWQLAKYVESLQLKAHWKGNILVEEVKGELPTEAGAEVWNEAPRTEVNLQGATYKGGHKELTSINAVSVQAVKNEAGVTLKLFWNDPTQEKADSFLVALLPKNFTGKGTQNLHNLYAPGAEPLDLYYWTASNPTVIRQVVSSVDSATGYGARFTNELKANAVYEDGLWTLVFNRPRTLKGADTLEESDKEVRIGFAAWNAGNSEAGLKRSASKWISLVLKADAGAHH